MTTRQRRFWSCSTSLMEGDSWCCTHRRAFRRGLLDDCPECGPGKELRFPTCLECRRAFRARPGEGRSPVGAAPRECCVYVLHLKDHSSLRWLYPRHEGAPHEAQDGTILHPTAGCTPRPGWFTVVESRTAA